MELKKSYHLFIFVLFCAMHAHAQKNFFPIFTETAHASILYDKEGPKLDSIAANLLAADIERVTDYKPQVLTDLAQAKGNIIVIGAVQSALVSSLLKQQVAFMENLKGQWERFGLMVLQQPTKSISTALVIAGSDARGTAYGVFTLSEKIGVSPWYWWADVPIKKHNTLTVQQTTYLSPSPAVKYRGVFINDEDWGLQPWAAKTFEPETGDIGPKTYAKVFELLLRLKANLIWPAMHPSTQAFFHYPGNPKMAADYQIVIGSSHAEPMLRNNVSEWNVKTMGRFNYLTNKDQILRYWEDRVKESKGIEAIYSLGMRGVHDGQMEGVKDLKTAAPLVEGIMHEERNLLAKYINPDVTAIPQVLTPYKEVLEIYDHGLKVPDDVTLVWPDDNYGYIHRLNNEQERTRKGGAGVYYHASYWGRPHDYLWLPSTHPSLMREEMMKAYETGAQTLWVLNVGDIKPQEYNIQQFLDMAYDPQPFQDSRYTQQHLLRWVGSIFGKEKAQQIQAVLWEYLRLAFERKPEFMGWSQTEPNTPTSYTAFNHFDYGDEAQRRIDRYDALERAVNRLRSQLDTVAAAAFYELVYYPVMGASQINKKFLYRDKSHLYAKQNRLSAYTYAQQSKAAYDRIVRETAYYNTQLANGKWQHIMTMNPRKLAVYQEPVIPAISIDRTAVWGIAPEGCAASGTVPSINAASLSLPPFDVYNKQRYFVDIFLKKDQAIKWSATTSQPWIRLSKMSGELLPQPEENQMRLWVDVDWSQLNQREKVAGNVTFTAGSKQVRLSISANSTAVPALSHYQGFIENNGTVVMHAGHFSEQSHQQPTQWAIVQGLGYTQQAIQALPFRLAESASAHPDSIKNNAFVAYDFYTFTSAKPTVSVMALPTHAVNHNFGVRYAVSIDEGPLKLVDIQTFGRSAEWKQNVLRNRTERTIEMPFLEAGKHRLKIYVVDPGVIVDEIRINLGGLKPAYSALPETLIK